MTGPPNLRRFNTPNIGLTAFHAYKHEGLTPNAGIGGYTPRYSGIRAVGFSTSRCNRVSSTLPPPQTGDECGLSGLPRSIAGFGGMLYPVSPYCRLIIEVVSERPIFPAISPFYEVCPGF